jgi:predicted RNA-binding protein with RPS1 domain
MDRDSYNIQHQNFIQENPYRHSFVQQNQLPEIYNIQEFKNDLSHVSNQLQYFVNTLHDLRKVQQKVSNQLQNLYRFEGEVTALYSHMFPNHNTKHYSSNNEESRHSDHSSRERHSHRDYRKDETDRGRRKHPRDYHDEDSTRKRLRHQYPERSPPKYPVRSAFCWITHIPISENKEELSQKIIETFKDVLKQTPVIRFIGMSADYPTTYRVDVDIPTTVVFTNDLEFKLCAKIHKSARLKIPKMYYK